MIQSTAHRLRGTRGRWAALSAALVLPAFSMDACEGRSALETRTFELQYMEPEEAVEMVAPYVYSDREGSPGVITHFRSGITVRETPEALDRIAGVLETYDRAKPGVRLHLQIIEADGFTESDERIADVRAVLEDLFRFDGYRLVAETQLALMEGTSSNQYLAEGDRQFELAGRVMEVRPTGAGGSVVVVVDMAPVPCCGRISTTLAVPVGETVVLGSTKLPGEPTLILTVRPELLPLSTG